ncbi:hypothetical protein G4B88_021827 [Cannabis sativa]|uniref:Uncharacterized protein n=1 Tax=Cannabis sativa TaxID=3483 RepID=A0A7J6EI21_CANSA|nr:hypothetical protein G4B88_021827 [Cannabis sativa]
MKRISYRNNRICFDRYALQALEPTWITSRQIEVERRAMTQNARCGRKIWIRIFLDKLVTIRPTKTRMGSGKESLEYRIDVVNPVRIEFNALDPRTASCLEFLAQCNARKAKESNPACQVLVKRRTDDEPPKIAVTFVNGVEEVFDATSTPAQNIRNMILEKGQHLETEQMFREAGESWPVLIPEEEIHQYAPGTKPRKAEEKKQ